MATINPSLPNAQSPFVEVGSGTATRAFFQWCLSINRSIADLQNGQVVPPPSGDYLPSSANVIGQNSILVLGALSSGVATVVLDGDVLAPSKHQYYGSDGASSKGWFDIADAFASSATVAKSVDADGVSSFDLTDVTVTVGGMLKKYGFDPKGRLAAEGDATTDDLPEGTTNLYFTDERARAAVTCCEILVADGVSAPPIMLTNEAEDDFLYSD